MFGSKKKPIFSLHKINRLFFLITEQNMFTAQYEMNLKILSDTFINQLMHSIVRVIDVKILLYTSKSLKDTHYKLLQHVSDHIGSIIRE